MMRLKYAGGEVFVSDEASHALLHYAEGLALSDSSDTVALPVVTIDGVAGVAEILIGPASQLLALPAAEKFDLDDAEVIASMREKLAALQPSRPIASEPETPAQATDDFEMGWP
jgi:hypothetical protein